MGIIVVILLNPQVFECGGDAVNGDVGGQRVVVGRDDALCLWRRDDGVFSNVRQRQSKGQLVPCGCLVQGEGGTHFGKGRQEVIDGEDIGFVGSVEEGHDLSGGGTVFNEERGAHF